MWLEHVRNLFPCIVTVEGMYTGVFFNVNRLVVSVWYSNDNYDSPHSFLIGDENAEHSLDIQDIGHLKSILMALNNELKA